MRSMPSDEKTRDALLDIRDNILWAQQFAQGLTFEAFRASRLHFYATTRALEIISEASRRLPDDLRARHPDLPWRAIRDVGNFYRHAYDNVLEDRIWRTLQGSLTPLLDAVLREIEALESP
jgi:uncharacterized protein with HEPN domain